MNAVISNVQDNTSAFNKEIAKQQPELLLSKRILYLCQIFSTLDFEYIELVGVTCNFSYNNFEKKVIKVLEKVGCTIEEKNVQAFYRIIEKNKTIVAVLSERLWKRT